MTTATATSMVISELTIASANDSFQLDSLSVKKASLILRSLNHKLRQQITKLIDDHKRLTVTEIYVKLRLEQSVASQHLAILRKAGIVKTERDGKFIFYTVNYSRIRHLENCIKSFLAA